MPGIVCKHPALHPPLTSCQPPRAFLSHWLSPFRHFISSLLEQGLATQPTLRRLTLNNRAPLPSQMASHPFHYFNTSPQPGKLCDSHPIQGFFPPSTHECVMAGAFLPFAAEPAVHVSQPRRWRWLPSHDAALMWSRPGTIGPIRLTDGWSSLAHYL